MDIKKIADNFDQDKLERVKDNKFFQQELDLILTTTQVLLYYKHIITNIDIDKTNPQNSYVMWIFNKVHCIDYDQPTQIVKSRVSLPDVDMDFEIKKRGRIIEYIGERFGYDRVAQMLTFNKMKGRSALKDVLRVRGVCDFATMNKMTAFIPDEAEIADQLQIMKEEDKKLGGDGKASIIQWALENHADDLREYAYIDETGNIQGEFGKIFAQAIRLENTKRSQGKHAAGVIISSEPLAEVCPMVYDKNTEEMICGMEMNDLESMGHVKVDVLGIGMLDKIHGVIDLLYCGEFEE